MMRLCNNCNESRPGSVTRCRSCGGVEFRIESLIPKGASKMKVKKRKISVFDLSELEIADEYQRDVIGGHVDKIEEEFVEEAFGLPCVGVEPEAVSAA